MKLDKIDREIYRGSEAGRAYLEYREKIGGDPFGYTTGMPVEAAELVEKLGGVDGLYRECVKRGLTWEELTGWNGHSDELQGL